MQWFGMQYLAAGGNRDANAAKVRAYLVTHPPVHSVTHVSGL
jgi:hypothetical protein